MHPLLPSISTSALGVGAVSIIVLAFIVDHPWKPKGCMDGDTLYQ